ncbi:MAG: AAA family ATPase, partial [Acidobacteria bacterium]|nr:AAA family ATPase [Acidobacteriota bacterium]
VSTRNVPVEYDSAEYLRKLCLSNGRTELRACYPLDIVNIIGAISQYESRVIQVTKPDLERAVQLYFARS